MHAFDSINVVRSFARSLARCRYVVRDASSGEETVLHVTKEQAQSGSDSHLRDPKTGRELEVVDKVSRSVNRLSEALLDGWMNDMQT